MHKELSSQLTEQLMRFIKDRYVPINQCTSGPIESTYDKQSLLYQIHHNECLHQLLAIVHDMNSNLEPQQLLRKILDACISFLEAERGAILLVDQYGEFSIRQARNNVKEDIAFAQFAIPRTVIDTIKKQHQTLFIPDLLESDTIAVSQSIARMRLRSVMCAPLFSKPNISHESITETLMGMIYLDSRQTTCTGGLVQSNVELLQCLADQASVALHNAMLNTELENMIKEKSRIAQALEQEVAERKAAEDAVRALNQTLEERIRQRTKELEKAQNAVLEKTYKAGMADIATAIMHTMGNVLTSAVTSSQRIAQTLSQSEIDSLLKANDLLRENLHNAEQFLFHDPRGTALLQYYLVVGDRIKTEYTQLCKNSQRLNQMHEMLTQILHSQQQYIIPGTMEQLSIAEMVDDMLLFLAQSFKKLGVVIEKKYGEVPLIRGQKFKIKHLLTTILENALEAVEENPAGKDRRISVCVQRHDGKIEVSIGDNGTGIDPENIPKIFTHGFTTKKDHFGFGLHQCANYMAEMGGKIEAQSDGKGKGTIVSLYFTIEANIQFSQDYCSESEQKR